MENEIDELTDRQKSFFGVNSPMITHIVTLAKYIIYEARRAEKLSSFAHFQRCLSRDIETERFIARKTKPLKVSIKNG